LISKYISQPRQKLNVALRNVANKANAVATMPSASHDRRQGGLKTWVTGVYGWSG
jgi:hypothetical protein